MTLQIAGSHVHQLFDLATQLLFDESIVEGKLLATAKTFKISYQIATFSRSPGSCKAYKIYLENHQPTTPEIKINSDFFQNMKCAELTNQHDIISKFLIPALLKRDLKSDHPCSADVHDWLTSFVESFITKVEVDVLLKEIITTIPRMRIREIGIKTGVMSTGLLNAITDVAGVKIGHATLKKDGRICTGVTAIIPHEGNLFQEKVPGAVFIGNAFGKLIGSTQVNELGQIETPILLTSTLSAPKVADALLTYMLNLPGNEHVLSINPLVGETNDGILNDGRSRPISEEDVFNAIHSAKEGSVEEGCIGAGTGTIAFGFKGGIGTSSRKLPEELGGWTVGVLVQSNFGGVLSIAGLPVGQSLGTYYLKDYLEKPVSEETLEQKPDGSIMIVVATDAPVDHRNLQRLAARTMFGLARTGACGSNGSGDYAIAFSTAPDLRILAGATEYKPKYMLGNDAMSPLFLAAIESTEEAIYNSLFKAEDTTSCERTIKAVPIEKILDLKNNF